MPADDVTHWIGRLRAGDPEAAGPLFATYFARLVGLARGRLREAPRRAADEEDVALSAFDSFCRGAEAGRFPRLDDRDDLWQVLLVLCARKAADLARREGRLKRGGGRLAQELDPGVVAADGPSPEFAALVADECRHLLDRLGDDTLRQVAVWKMEGYTSAEIAARLGRSEGTVERKLALIRKAWSVGVADGD
ncbi:ECF-type sigma factor [Urbifossiella limnaea]|uniref:ECF sigma factor n=1 Tax=Urbifossiella limnaea TaxID=2528023 RepID=A0A517Y1Q6_9BACT|nr:ECF-type sigma factor [Urbifossiella limnaea]QDU23690.1 ECF sigma factor [Urbifossiella limnaea]